MDQTHELLRALETDGVLSAADAAHATELCAATRDPVDLVLTRLGLVSEADLAQRLAARAGLPLLDARALAAAHDFTECDDRLNGEFLLHQRVLPVGRDATGIRVAMVDPDNSAGLDGVRFALGEAVAPMVGTAAQIEQVWKRRFERDGEVGDGLAGHDVSADSDRLRDMASSAPAIRLANRIIAEAVEQGASDIHLEPGLREAEIRFRVDGTLRPVDRLASAQALALVSRIKVLADLDIAERRRPQDGRVSLPVGGRTVDLRISVVPAQHGESLVIRLLDAAASLRELHTLGFSPQVGKVAQDIIGRPNGLVLVTGPTGSGKTTTLYAFLRQLADGERKILTIEDPVEYRLEGVAQSQTNPLIDVTFASALRAFLRHDPDIIMVGEIRDAETARTAVQAAMTGHLVLSTLHTNDAPSAIVRLIDMGVEDYLLASTLNGVIGQRLVRTVCASCRGAGCEACGKTGYRGRMAIAEGFAVNAEIRDLIAHSRSETELRAALARTGYVPMSELGRRQVDAGTIREIDLRRAVGEA